MLLWLKAKWAIPLVRKAVIYGGIAILLSTGIGFAVYRYGTAQWQKGEQKGREAVARDMDEQLTAQREAAEQALAAKDAAIADEREASRQERLELIKSRREMEAASAKRMEQILSSLGKKNAQADLVPDSDLDDTLRATSARLPDPR